MLVVLDTNVLVSSLLKHDSKPAQIIHALIEQKIHLAIDERILKEYTEVIHRPKLNIPPEKADAILRFISYTAQWIHGQPIHFPHELINDPNDLPFAEVALWSHAEVIITGNLKHFAFMKESGTKILLPDEFLSTYF